MQGFIKDWRQEINSDIWLMPPLYHRVWQWIKYNVNHTGREIPFADGTKIFIGPGERITSLRQIAKGVGYFENGVWKEPHVQTIRRILSWLETAKMLQVTCDTKYTHVKVLNWGVYQDVESDVCDKECTASVQSCTTNKNDKNDKKLKKEINKEKNVVEKIQYAEFVSLTNAEHEALVAKVGEDGIKKCIEILDNYKGSTGKKYKSDYRTILNWVVQRYEDDKKKPVKSVPQAGNFEQRKYDDEYYEGFYKNTAGAK